MLIRYRGGKVQPAAAACLWFIPETSSIAELPMDRE
jgi:hypothetical protein